MTCSLISTNEYETLFRELLATLDYAMRDYRAELSKMIGNAERHVN